MADRSRSDDAAVTKIVVEVVDRLGDRLADATSAVQKTLELEIGELRVASEPLHLHVNSVKYRIQRAIQRRGRPIGDDRLDVELALLVCQWFGAVVLRSERS